MKQRTFKWVLAGFLAAGSVGSLMAWGTFGHQHINHAAVLALPSPMQSFFYNHIDFITEESVVPDLRKYTINDKAENPRHYIDWEGYDSTGTDPIPRTMKEAQAKYDEKYLQKMGILPWYIQDMMDKLTKAFQNKRKTEILFLAADLGHYIGDANMPLHTSINHDGQKTNQKGIHSFWEAQIPEIFGGQYNYYVTSPTYLPDVTTATWNIIRHSHELADTLLAIEREVRARFPEDKIYVKNDSGQIVKNKFNQKVFTMAYAKAYHDAMQGMVEKQMQHAIQDLVNFWYTAWVNAGKPDLNALDPASLTKANLPRLKEELRLYKKGKLSGFKIENEYNN
jgi:hypothetical protein